MRKMKRLLFVVLMTVCSISCADWEYTIETNTGSTSYHDKSSIRRSGVSVKMWMMTDFSSAQTSGGRKYKSSKRFVDYNCAEETFALISVVNYSGSMGEGGVVRSMTWQERELEWEPLVPGTVVEAMWKIACGKN